ncbi:MAG: inorganic diphosphatase [Anaerolineae bacterium]
MNLWHELPTGPQAPDRVYAIIEIPSGSRNKYEYSKRTGVILLNRVLYSSVHYPGDYGLIPRTFYDDGDPLDILVMTTQPTFPGCVIEARPVGMFRMIDRGKSDDKVLAVPATDPNFNDIHDLDDMATHFKAEVAHFFSTYKQLENIVVEPIGWESAEFAKAQIRHAMRQYEEHYSGIG